MSKREDEVIDYRLNQRATLLAAGTAAYPQDGHKTHTNWEALAQPVGTEVTVAGRVRAVRGHGKIKFFDLEDDSGKVQVVIKEDLVENFDSVTTIGTSDFMRVTGTRFTTKAGEESIQVAKFELLAKAIRILPDAWGDDALKDEETRYRLRSVDLALYPERRELFKKRSRIIASVRETLTNTNFIEMETPTLQSLYGGANARPFITRINAWDIPMYLRISPELYLKYLIMGGFDRVFEITKNFRNEGVDRTHNPEFTMMECYSAYWDYTDMMNLTEEIYRNAAQAANGSPVVTFQGVEIDFSQPWRRLPMKEAIKEYLQIDVDTLTDDQLKEAIAYQKLEYEGEWIRGLGIATLFEAVEKNLIQPTFIIDFPRETTTLCKPHRSDSTLIERFEPYIMGWEVGNAYTELNDPILQRQFWEEERAGDPEAHPLDENFIEAMEYGMPPTGGLGLGIDRLVMIVTNQTKIRDVILFPTMKPLKKHTQNEEPTATPKPVQPKKPVMANFSLPSREESLALMQEHIQNEKLRHHCEMVAQAMEAYAQKLGEDSELWYAAGLLHDVDWEEFPDEHPNKAIAEWLHNYPQELLDAVAAHAPQRTSKEPETTIEKYLFACDELSGLLHAISLMRPDGFVSMEVKSVKKKLKDKGFAQGVGRDDITKGVELIGSTLEDHIEFLISVFRTQA